MVLTRINGCKVHFQLLQEEVGGPYLLSSQEIEKRYNEMYDLMLRLTDSVLAALDRIKKLEERLGIEEVKE